MNIAAWQSATETIFVVLGPGIIAWAIWRGQIRREKHARTFDLLAYFESEAMKEDRRRCWDFLEAHGDAVQGLHVYVPSSAGHVLDFRACNSVLTFFRMVHDLANRKQVDRALAHSLFEPPRINFSGHFQHMSAHSTADGRYRHLFEALDNPLPAPRKYRDIHPQTAAR